MKKYITLEYVYKKSKYGDNVRRYGSVNLDEIAEVVINVENFIALTKDKLHIKGLQLDMNKETFSHNKKQLLLSNEKCDDDKRYT